MVRKNDYYRKWGKETFYYLSLTELSEDDSQIVQQAKPETEIFNMRWYD